MIEYVIFHNPDDRILDKANAILKNGGLVVFPTDTNWIVACDPFNKKAIEKLYKLKNADKQKHFSLLCHDISLASKLAIIDNTAFKLLKKVIPGHYTFIFEASKLITKSLQASKSDKEVGIRFVPSELVKKIISHYDGALMSTNITFELMETDPEEPIYSYMIEEKLRGIVEMIIDPGEFYFEGPSSIIDFSQGTGPMIVRAGSGDTSLFERVL